MKTITMDFDTYKQELLEARLSGLRDVPELVEALDTALCKLDRGVSTYDDFYSAVRLIREVKEKLKGVEEKV